MEKIGYKKLRHRRIAKLKILGKNNRNRKNIYNEKFATYKCSKAYVIEISDSNLNELKQGTSTYDPTFIYKVGFIVKVDNYSEHGSEGIYYFLTKQQASFWNPKMSIYHGYCENYYPEGRLHFSCFYEYGNMNGYYEELYENGKVKISTNYYMGRYDGFYRFYYENGNMCVESYYKRGILEGKYRLYNIEGLILLEANYSRGDKNGMTKEFYLDGKETIKSTIEYLDNKYTGMYITYHPNGKIKLEGTYNENSEKIGLWNEYDENEILLSYCKH